MLVHRVRNLDLEVLEPSVVRMQPVTDDCPIGWRPVLVMGYEDGSVALFDWVEGRKGSYVKSVALAPAKNGIQDMLVIQNTGSHETRAWNLCSEYKILSVSGDSILRQHGMYGSKNFSMDGGGIWALAQYKDMICLASQDGMLRFISTDLDSDFPEVLSTLSISKAGVHCLSIDWSAKGLCLGLDNGEVVLVESGLKAARRIKGEGLVWSTRFWGDYVLTGNSNGTVNVYSGTDRLQSFQIHKEDVLAIEVTPHGFFAGGADGRVTEFKWSSQDSEFIKTTFKRLHTGEVKGLAYSSGLLVSIGSDSQVVLTPATAENQANLITHSQSTLFSDSHQKRSPCTSNVPESVLIRQNKIYSLTKNILSVHQLPQLQCTQNGLEKTLEMQLNMTHTSTWDVSRDGTYCAVAERQVKVFRLHETPEKLAIPSIPNAKNLCFTRDSSRLIIAHEQISILDLESRSIIATLDAHKAEMHISHLLCSPDDAWLASIDSKGKISISNLDTLRIHAHLSQNLVSSCSFSPDSRHLIVCSKINDLAVYNIEKKGLVSFKTPKLLKSQLDHVIGLVFAGEKFLVWASTWLGSLDLNSILNTEADKKRRRQNAAQSVPKESIFEMTSSYKNLVTVNVVCEGQICIVEQPTIHAKGIM